MSNQQRPLALVHETSHILGAVEHGPTAASRGGTPQTRSGMFDLTITAGSGGARVVLRGDLEDSSANRLDDVVDIMYGADLPFQIDCRSLSYVSGGGVMSLVRAMGRGGSVLGLEGPVEWVLDALGLRPRPVPVPVPVGRVS